MIRVGIIGCGRTGVACAAALAAVPQVRVTSLCDRSSRALDAARRRLPVDSAYLRAESLLADPQVDAVVLAVPAGREALVRAAVRAGKPVLAAGLGGFSPEGLTGLAAWVEQSGGLVAVAVPAVEEEGFRLLLDQAGPRPPEAGYLRTLRSHPGGAVLALLAEEALALWLLTGVLPEHAAATAAGGEPERPAALFATLRYPSGLVAHLDITTLEPGFARRMALVEEGRTVVLDGDCPGGVVTVCRAPAGGPAVRLHPGPAGEAAAPLERACRRFAALVRGEAPRPDVGLADVAAATAVVEAARASLRVGGAPVPVEGDRPAPAPPVLRLIQGGGRGAPTRSRPARLRLVSR